MKLKEHYQAHFDICSEVVDPIELKDAPSFIRQLKDINNTEPSTTPSEIEQLKSTNLRILTIPNQVPLLQK